MARAATPAEQMRAHRLAMELALATGCTPREAAAELRRRENAAHVEALRKRRETPIDQAAAKRACPGAATSDESERFWWKRED